MFISFILIVDKALNGSNFIHVRLRYQKNCFESLGGSVRTVASNILRETGMSLDGDEEEEGTIIFEIQVLDG